MVISLPQMEAPQRRGVTIEVWCSDYDRVLVKRPGSKLPRTKPKKVRNVPLIVHGRRPLDVDTSSQRKKLNTKSWPIKTASQVIQQRRDSQQELMDLESRINRGLDTRLDPDGYDNDAPSDSRPLPRYIDSDAYTDYLDLELDLYRLEYLYDRSDESPDVLARIDAIKRLMRRSGFQDL